MNRRNFLGTSLGLAMTATANSRELMNFVDMNQTYSFRLLRNATFTMELEGINLLVDPMFSKKGVLDPIPWTANSIRNPLVDLPVSEAELKTIVDQVDAFFITHLHPDHWDKAAADQIPKNKLIICQPEDQNTLNTAGFNNLITDKKGSLKNLSFQRVSAKHGHGEISEKLGPVSGYILQYNSKVIYIAGDTVWCDEVASNLKIFSPDVIVVNSGAAQLNFDRPITMTGDEVLKVAEHSKESALIFAIHFEAINHCYLKRETLDQKINGTPYSKKIFIPGDGDAIDFGRLLK